MKKYITGFTALIISLLFVLVDCGQAFASNGTTVGGPSLSKYFYVETGEMNGIRTHGVEYINEVKFWKAVDTFIDVRMADGRINTHDYWHVWRRKLWLKADGSLEYGYDEHNIFCVLNVKDSAIVYENGWIRFKSQSTGQFVAFDSMIEDNGDGGANPVMKMQSFDAASPGYYVVPSNGTYTTYQVPKKMDLQTKYDPNNPPAYALPGYNDPNDSTTAPPDPTDPTDPNNPGMPVRPTPPENSWDLLGWLKYLVEWVVYIFDTLVWLIAQMAGKIGDLIAQGDGMVTVLTSFFSFLPPEITTLLGLGIITAIILTVFRK